MTSWTVPATIVRVVDADTYVADIDLGWRVWMRDIRIRLAGVNAPEMSTPEGVAARAWAVNLLNSLMPVGDSGPLKVPVRVVSHSLDKYGRVLGDVFYDLDPTGAGRRHLNGELLAAGHAVVMK